MERHEQFYKKSMLASIFAGPDLVNDSEVKLMDDL